MSTAADRYIRDRFEAEINAAYEWGCVVGAVIVVLGVVFGAGLGIGAVLF